VPEAFLTGDGRRRDLDDVPIPADWIVDGAPVARGTQLTASGRGSVSTHLWDCTAGRFHWHFGVDEIVHILDGEVHVTGDDGRTVTLRTGDVAHFPYGTHAIWQVDAYVRKLAVLRTRPRPLRALHRFRHDRRLQRWAAACSAATAVMAPVAVATPW
jgi:uncharacterized cupin superfamily protein